VKYLAYNSSKSAVNAITVQFAYELRGTPIKVNAADPGYVATDMNQASAELSTAVSTSLGDTNSECSSGSTLRRVLPGEASHRPRAPSLARSPSRHPPDHDDRAIPPEPDRRIAGHRRLGTVCPRARGPPSHARCGEPVRDE
jgi:NAD(P)-dependent dehydrogenase (short-subunit alcohol dehydrogenase family)